MRRTGRPERPGKPGPWWIGTRSTPLHQRGPRGIPPGATSPPAERAWVDHDEPPGPFPPHAKKAALAETTARLALLRMPSFTGCRVERAGHRQLLIGKRNPEEKRTA